MDATRSLKARIALVAIVATMAGSMVGSIALDSATAGNRHRAGKSFLAAVVALLSVQDCSNTGGGTSTVQCGVINTSIARSEVLNNLLRNARIDVRLISVEDALNDLTVNVLLEDFLNRNEIDVEDVVGVIVDLASDLIIVVVEK